MAVEDESLLLSESKGASKSAKGTLSVGRLSSKYLREKMHTRRALVPGYHVPGGYKTHTSEYVLIAVLERIGG